MYIKNKNIDGETPFDWGLVSKEYAKYRDIYPDEFYEKIVQRGLCVNGQNVLDLGTGTGVLPRNMYRYGAKWTAADISKEQIQQAKLLSHGKDITYTVSSAENISFPNNTFDVITACQCFWYFDHSITAKKFFNILKPNGRLLVLYMAWLPFEDEIAKASERLVLKYNSKWSGKDETTRPIEIPHEYLENFEITYEEQYPLELCFTRESWHGRMKACRGVGASLSKKSLALWEDEHKRLLFKIAPEKFSVKHYAAIAELKAKKQI